MVRAAELFFGEIDFKLLCESLAVPGEAAQELLVVRAALVPVGEQRGGDVQAFAGKQVNMVSQSWDGTRVYITSSLLANWDKTGENDDQFLRAFNWNGQELTPVFEVDFYMEKLGRAHHMKFGTNAIKAAYEDQPALASQQ